MVQHLYKYISSHFLCSARILDDLRHTLLYVVCKNRKLGQHVQASAFVACTSQQVVVTNMGYLVAALRNVVEEGNLEEDHVVDAEQASFREGVLDREEVMSVEH